MKYGVQLYSLRNIGKANGLEAILKTVADAGYDGVEFAGFYGHTPEEVKALCEKYNIEYFMDNNYTTNSITIIYN